MAQNIILTVHILACIALTVVILLQRSEGGALGIGGGGGGGGLMSGRAAINALVRTTMIFGAGFMMTTLALTALANSGDDDGSEVTAPPAIEAEETLPSTPEPLPDTDDQPAPETLPAPLPEDAPTPEDTPAPEEELVENTPQ